MSKPPVTPPSSDLDGVNEDRASVNAAENADNPGGKLKKEEDGGTARPKPSRA